MNKTYENVQQAQREALGQLSYEAVVSALENEEQAVMEAVHERMLYYTDQAGESLKEGNDYLTVLTPTPKHSGIDAVAMDIVREAFDEELEAL